MPSEDWVGKSRDRYGKRDRGRAGKEPIRAGTDGNGVRVSNKKGGGSGERPGEERNRPKRRMEVEISPGVKEKERRWKELGKRVVNTGKAKKGQGVIPTQKSGKRFTLFPRIHPVYRPAPVPYNPAVCEQIPCHLRSDPHRLGTQGHNRSASLSTPGSSPGSPAPRISGPRGSPAPAVRNTCRAGPESRPSAERPAVQTAGPYPRPWPGHEPSHPRRSASPKSGRRLPGRCRDPTGP